MLALLHTSPVHVPVFDALGEALDPRPALRHVVRPELLARAREEGPEAVADDVAEALAEAARAGAAAALCTCSTLGSVAEAAGARLRLPTLRVDRPMAAAAVAAGPRITVLATVRSTLGPTTDLITDEAHRAGRVVAVRPVLVDGAWERFETGDTDGHLDAVATAIRQVSGDADAVVLAQASMAPAAAIAFPGADGEGAAAGAGAPVLSSPRSGLRAAAALLETVRGAGAGGRG